MARSIFTSSKNTKLTHPHMGALLLTPRAEIRVRFISLYWLSGQSPCAAMRGVWLNASETRTGRGTTPSLCDELWKANHKVSLSKPIRLEWLASAGEEFLCLLSCRYKKVGRSSAAKKHNMTSRKICTWMCLYCKGHGRPRAVQGLARAKRNRNKNK